MDPKSRIFRVGTKQDILGISLDEISSNPGSFGGDSVTLARTTSKRSQVKHNF